MGLNVEAELAHFTKTMRRPAPAVAAAMSLGEALLERSTLFGLNCLLAVSILPDNVLCERNRTTDDFVHHALRRAKVHAAPHSI